MMTYDITLRGLKRNQVMDIVDALPKGISFACVRNDEPATIKGKVKPGKNVGIKRRTGDAALMLTGKDAAPGTIRDKALKAFMKLEKKHGPGGVTRKMMHGEINKMGADASTLNSLITAGLLKHVDEGE